VCEGIKIVTDVDRWVTEKQHVRRVDEGGEFGMRPKYLRHNLWSLSVDPMMSAAEWMLSASRLPPPPQNEYENLAAIRMIEDNPTLFKIVTPIKVDVLEILLESHPNQPFVNSVLDGLRKGFWPWASIIKDGYPVTLDKSRPICLTPEKEDFLNEQLKHEQSLERMSQEFGEDLLPGMYCIPSYVIPKLHSDGWCLVDDLSAGPCSLNSMVDHQCVTGYQLDNLAQLDKMMMKKCYQAP